MAAIRKQEKLATICVNTVMRHCVIWIQRQSLHTLEVFEDTAMIYSNLVRVLLRLGYTKGEAYEVLYGECEEVDWI